MNINFVIFFLIFRKKSNTVFANYNFVYRIFCFFSVSISNRFFLEGKIFKCEGVNTFNVAIYYKDFFSKSILWQTYSIFVILSSFARQIL